MKHILLGSVALAAAIAAPSLANAEDVDIKGSVGDVFGHRVVLDADSKKYLVNLGPKISELGTVKSGDKLSVKGDLTKSGEVRAYTITLADGKELDVAKDKKSWREWLLGEDSGKHATFTADDAKKLASDKGYTLQGEPVAEKKHFKAKATKDGKSFDIDLHRDGKIIAETAFGVEDAKKLAKDKGYTLTGEPVAEKKHFAAKATKDGKSYDLDLHRDGTIKEEVAFNADDAKRAIMAKGYDVIGEPQRIKKHYEALTRKSSEYFEVHANRDGAIKEARKVEKTDPKWGAQIP